MEELMRRLTCALAAGLCLCGTAAAQSENGPPGVGGRFHNSAGGIGRADFQTQAGARASLGLPSSPGRNPARVGPQFGAGEDARTSAGGAWADRLDDRLTTGGRISAEARQGRNDGWQAGHPIADHPIADHPIADRAGEPFAGDAAFDPRTGGLTVEGQAELMLRNRLAAIDRLRDSALEHGDTELLEEADRLEQQARLRFQSRGRMAGPAPSPVQSADYESSSTAPGGVMPASGHPIRDFAVDTSAEPRSDGRDFGLRTSTNARAGGREFGTGTAAAAQFQEPGPEGVSAAGGIRSSDWYNAQPPAQAGSGEVQARAVMPDAGLPARGAFGRPAGWRGLEHRADANSASPAWSGDPAAFDQPLPPQASRGGPAPGGGASGDPRLSQQAFDSQLAAEARLGGRAFGQRTSEDPGLPPHAFDPRTNVSAGFRGQPLGQEPENDDMIFYGRSGSQAQGPSAPAGFGQATAADARADGRAFGQATAADAREFGSADAGDPRTAGWEFGQSTAADARTDGRAFGQAASTDARAGAEPRGRAAWTDELGVTTGASGTRLDAESAPRRDRRSESAAPPPRQSEPAPKKRGLFSWLRGRGEARNRSNASSQAADADLDLE
jgi:hypothetical protein